MVRQPEDLMRPNALVTFSEAGTSGQDADGVPVAATDGDVLWTGRAEFASDDVEVERPSGDLDVVHMASIVLPRGAPMPSTLLGAVVSWAYPNPAHRSGIVVGSSDAAMRVRIRID